MFNNPVELKSFCQINQKFAEYPYYKLPLQNDQKRKALFEKLKLVADIEDYTFFMRKKSYSCFSVEFIKSVISKKKRQNKKVETENVNWINRILGKLRCFFTWSSLASFVKKKHKIRGISRYVNKFFIRICDYLAYKLDYEKKRVKRYIRGYSTIEMQLIRILSYQKGLKMGKPKTWKDMYLVFTRKVYEIIYAPIFFTGHKNYLNISVEKDYYKYYLVYIYLHTVQTNLNGRVFAPLDKIFGDVDVMEWPMEALFIIVLGLSNMKITKNRVDVYINIIEKYNLNLELLYQLVNCIE